MANPNLVNVGNIQLKSITTTVVSGGVLSGITNKVLKIQSIILCNTLPSFDVDIFINLVRGGTTYAIADGIVIPAGSTLVVVDGDYPIYLQEGDSITAAATASSGVNAIISYSEIS